MAGIIMENIKQNYLRNENNITAHHTRGDCSNSFRYHCSYNLFIYILMKEKPTPALDVKEDGQIWLIEDCPVEPNVHHSVFYLSYQKALASADRLLVSNQEVAEQIIQTYRYNIEVVRCKKNVGSKESPIYDFPREENCTTKPGIYPIPDLKWEVKDVPIERDASTFSHYEREAGKQLVTEYTKVAVLI